MKYHKKLSYQFYLLMKKMNKAVYIHIPFCSRICTYCDFCKMYYKSDWVKAYLKSLSDEVNKYYDREPIETIYIGGGTPSILNKQELRTLFKMIEKINTKNLKEFTFEFNVEDITEEKLRFLKKNKVNRLSIGVQSFNEKNLHFLNRHIVDIKEKVLLAKRYFDNINIDLIFGLKDSNLDEVKEDLKSFLELDLPHLSVYGLIKEKNTILSVMKYKELDDESFNKMYYSINDFLKKHGYIHYEVSNYAREGYFSLHNLNYWNNENYYGFGLGAAGYIGNKRYMNTRNLNKYLRGEYRFEEDELTEKEEMENEMILGLRKVEGVSNQKFYDRFSKNIKDVFPVSKLIYRNGYYKVREKDIFTENSILIDFILDK